jgi:hypothetical protein
MVAYSSSEGPESKSEVWIAGVDGAQAHRVSAPEDDATLPAFGEGDKSVLYVKSRFSGHYSPIARPRRHEFDIVKVAVDKSGPIAGMVAVELTQQYFFDLWSLAVSPDGSRFLISTSGYPIGSLIEEFEVAHPDRIKKIFQPRVLLSPSIGPSYGEAAFIHDGMDIVFTAATEGAGGNYDYNVYQMSDVTGGEIMPLSKHTGPINSLVVEAGDHAYFYADGKWDVLNTTGKKQ